jgi:hypothetical protein
MLYLTAIADCDSVTFFCPNTILIPLALDKTQVAAKDLRVECRKPKWEQHEGKIIRLMKHVVYESLRQRRENLSR